MFSIIRNNVVNPITPVLFDGDKKLMHTHVSYDYPDPELSLGSDKMGRTPVLTGEPVYAVLKGIAYHPMNGKILFAKYRNNQLVDVKSQPVNAEIGEYITVSCVYPAVLDGETVKAFFWSDFHDMRPLLSSVEPK